MARDAALLARAAETGESVFSVYTWDRPTLSFGRNQRASGQYDRDAIRERKVDVVRRPTGGRAILHHREITYSVTAPVAQDGSLRESYDRINRILVEGLRRVGVTAEIASEGKSIAPDSIPCFELPSQGEIVAGGRKLVGSAQWREENAFLQHGSILVDDDQSSLASLAADPFSEAAVIPPAPATLRSLLGRAPTAEVVASALFGAVTELEDCEGTVLEEDEVRASALAKLPEYLDDNWTWRR
jgi:lipoyl(octanoyl) transferase